MKKLKKISISELIKGYIFNSNTIQDKENNTYSASVIDDKFNYKADKLTTPRLIPASYTSELTFNMKVLDQALIIRDADTVYLCSRYATNGFLATKISAAGNSLNITCDNDGNVTVKPSNGGYFTVSVLFLR